MQPPTPLKSFALLNGMVVMTGQAQPELDHGNRVWVCSTMPPLKQQFEAVSTREDAIGWLKRVAGASSIFEGTLLPD